eukprot:TRINITY_DN254_c0_g1_i1.p1 TRINITY_DN254_c0_g1~~TRINITY_DN254_c0_g1_i1.p1  ORF type:complete len:308 (-),score=94.10 TRINITY_DN254_c0_g1_i1:30-911(-)
MDELDDFLFDQIIDRKLFVTVPILCEHFRIGIEEGKNRMTKFYNSNYRNTPTIYAHVFKSENNEIKSLCISGVKFSSVDGTEIFGLSLNTNTNGICQSTSVHFCNEELLKNVLKFSLCSSYRHPDLKVKREIEQKVTTETTKEKIKSKEELKRIPHQQKSKKNGTTFGNKSETKPKTRQKTESKTHQNMHKHKEVEFQSHSQSDSDIEDLVDDGIDNYDFDSNIFGLDVELDDVVELSKEEKEISHVDKKKPSKKPVQKTVQEIIQSKDSKIDNKNKTKKDKKKKQKKLSSFF